MGKTRVMDAQQECIQKLERDFHNFKKQPIPKRTIEWLKSEDEKRHAIWEKIQENHQVLRVSYPPPDYGKYYEKSVKINSEFIAKLYEWGYNTTFTQDAVSLSTIEEEGSSDESTETVKQADGSNQKQGHGESNIPPRYEEAVGCEVSTTTAEQNQSNFPPSAPIISQPLPTTTIMTTVYQTPQMNTGAIPKNIFRTYTFTPTSFVNVDPSLTPPTMTTASHSTGLKTSNNVNNSNINYNQSNTSTNFSSVDSNACGGGAALNSEPNTHNNQNNVSTTTDRNPDIVTIDGQGNIQYNYDAWKNSPNYNPDFVLSQPPINAGQSMNQPQNSGFNPNSGNPNNFINAGQSMNQPQNSGFNPNSGNPNNFINAGQSMNQPQNSGFNPNSGNPNNFINAGQSMNQPQNSGFNPNSGNPNNFINAGQSMNQPQNSGFNPNSGFNFINAGQSMNQPQNSGFNPNSGNPNNFINAGQSMNQPQNSGFNPNSGNPNNFINAGQSMNQPQNMGYNEYPNNLNVNMGQQSQSMNTQYRHQGTNLEQPMIHNSRPNTIGHSSPQEDSIDRLAAVLSNMNRGNMGWERSIPIFSGNLREYVMFKDACNEVIGRSPLSETSKFFQLRKHLDGEALREVGSISDNTVNAYTEAWKKLDRKYKNNRTFVMWNVDTIINGGLCIKERTLEAIQNVRYNVEKLDTLITREYDGDLITPKKMIVETVLLQMDPKTKKRAKYYFGNLTDTPTTHQLVEFLIGEENQLTPDRFTIESQPDRTDSKKDHKKEKLPKSNNPKSGRKHHSIANVAQNSAQQDHDNPCQTQSSASQGQNKENSAPNAHAVQAAEKCLICKSTQHLTPLECPILLEAEDRQGILKGYKLCLYCGVHKYSRKRNKQDPGTCPNYHKLKCAVCQKPHETMFHDSISKYYDAVERRKRKQQAEKQSASENHENSHHAMAIMDESSQSEKEIDSVDESDNDDDHSTESELVHTRVMELCQSQSLVPTIRLPIITSSGCEVEVKTLVDNGSTKSYIRQGIIDILGLKTYKFPQAIHGIGNVTTSGNKVVLLSIRRPDQSIIELVATILPEVAGLVPYNKIDCSNIGRNKNWADPNIGRPEKIDLLIGTQSHYLLINNQFPIDVNSDPGLTWTPTHWGWMVGGTPESEKNKYRSVPKQEIERVSKVQAMIALNEVNEGLRSIVTYEDEQEEESLRDALIKAYALPEPVHDDSSDKYCEELFMSKHYRMDMDKITPDTGRYVVPIPWMEDAPKLGESYNRAMGCYLAQERKWMSNNLYRELSNEFMLEYIALNHMTPVDRDKFYDRSGNVCYLPVISVYRSDAYTTKLRNVFNASAKTSNGVSLNDTMHEGPKLQNHIFNVVTQCRVFPYIYSSDIVKMFRQIRILPSDSEKMRILWRPSPKAAIHEYELKTCTYGTDAAPWQAIRTIQQCATDNAPDDEIKQIIIRGMYVDDLLFGSYTIEAGRAQIQKIIDTLNAGKFPLSKWMSNDSRLLENIPENQKITSYMASGFEYTKLLGLIYDRHSDTLRINIKDLKELVFTKRGVASVTASFYDPNGWILPFVMSLRIFLRDVWALQIGWDDPLDEKSQLKFQELLKNVDQLKHIRIPRWLGTGFEQVLELVGFADASKDAQGAVIYSRVKAKEGYTVRIVAAKGNVAKLQSQAVVESRQQTIPKLELNAVVTMAHLLDSIKDCFPDKTLQFTAYTDSEIVLAWIRNDKVRLTYIRKRVDKIKKQISAEQIHHVPGIDNPADRISRGCDAATLAADEHFYNGPAFLQQDELPQTPFEIAPVVSCVAREKPYLNEIPIQEDMFLSHIFATQGQHNLIKMKKVVAIMLRWKRKTTKMNASRVFVEKNGVKYYHSTFTELQEAEVVIARAYQRYHMPKAFDLLETNKDIPKGHVLRPLAPFLDEYGAIRVGGRLSNASAPHEVKHPLFVPAYSHLAQVIIKDAHEINFHAGNTITLQEITRNYWIPAVKLQIRSIINKCVPCIAWKAKTVQPEMADLPAERLDSAMTFQHTGVDLAGPLTLKSSVLKQARDIKAYIVVFVCMLTRGVHLELITALTSEHFMQAFDRFCARRNTPDSLFSDNGSNFIGANRILMAEWMKIQQTAYPDVTAKNINWRFIPRYSPSFGGLYEAAVKSTKHLLRMVNDTNLMTFEQFSTLLCKVEFLLNSRPLGSTKIDPNEEEVLTPQHFMTLRATSTHSAAAAGIKSFSASYKRMLLLYHKFCERFQRECWRIYQKRAKWQKGTGRLVLDQIVLIKEAATLPGAWPKGRIIKIYPDPHGTVRKVDVKRSNGTITHESYKNIVPISVTDESKDQPRRVYQTRNNQRHRLSAPQLAAVGLALFSTMQPATAMTILTSTIMNSTFSSTTMTPNVNMTFASELTKPTLAPEGLTVQQLEPGLHIRWQKTKSFVKGPQIEFSLDTGFDIDSDVSVIKNLSSNFRSFCEELNKNVSMLKISTHCNNIQTTLDMATSTTVHRLMEIKNSAVKTNQRERRGLGGAVVKLGAKIGRGVKSAATSATFWSTAVQAGTVAAAVFQEFEIQKLRGHINEINRKRVAAEYMLKTALNLEHETMEQNLKSVVKTQMENKLVTEINEYSNAVDSTLILINKRYELASLEPIIELEEYMSQLRAAAKNLSCILPESDETFRHTKIHIENGTLHLVYYIQLRTTDELQLLTVLTLPDKDLNMINALDDRLVSQFMVLNQQIYQEAHDQLGYENNNWKTWPEDSCLHSVILEQNNSFSKCNNVATWKNWNEAHTEIVHLSKSWIVVNPNKHEVVFACDETYVMTTNELIEVQRQPNCSLFEAGKLIAGLYHASFVWNSAKIKDISNIAQIKLATLKIADLKMTSETELNWQKEENSHLSWIIVFILAFSLFSLIISVVIALKRKSRPPKRWFPNWEGPLMNDGQLAVIAFRN